MSMSSLAVADDQHVGFIMAAAVVAMTAVISLPLLQSDYVSRIFFLSAQQVYQKRQTEYQYRWSFLLEKILLHTLDQLGGDSFLELLVNDDEIKDFIDKCLNINNNDGPRVVALGIDEKLSTRPTCVWILFQGVVHQIVLKEFVRLLYPRLLLHNQSTTTTAMCFVAEATAGQGPHIIECILQEVPLLNNVSVVRQPQWMAMLAQLFQNQIDSSLSTTILEQALFAFTKLEANNIFLQDKDNIKTTVCFTLPGQAVSAVLMPHLCSVFPHERHVFIYDGCCANVVSRAAATTTKPKHVVGPAFALEHPYKHSTPMLSSTFMSRLSNQLSKLPLSLADTTQTWITTMDVFLTLNKETKNNKYLPFVCKLDSLSQERPLQNVLQFMTGNLPDGVLEQALDVLEKHSLSSSSQPSSSFLLSPKLSKAIEDCVLQYKRIENKTFIDSMISPQVGETPKVKMS